MRSILPQRFQFVRPNLKTRSILKVILIGFVLLLALIPFPASWIENYYSNGFYPRVQWAFTPLSNLFSFALIDVWMIALFTGIPVWWIRAIIKAGRGHRWRAVGRLALNTMSLAALIASGFLILWGLNYQRIPLKEKLDFASERMTADTVREFKRRAVERVDAEYLEARTTDWPDKEAWRSELHKSFGEVLALMGRDRNIAAAIPKNTIFDFYLGSAGIGGFVNPFGQEVILDSERLPFEEPFVLAHEWAHLAGFANESEASFIGTLACIRSDMPAIRYSGWLDLYQSVPWRVMPEDIENDQIKAVPPKPSPGVQADIDAITERYVRRYKPSIGQAQWEMYDKFLKANRVEEGTRSYGLFVDLLLGTKFEEGWKPVRRE